MQVLNNHRALYKQEASACSSWGGMGEVGMGTAVVSVWGNLKGQHRKQRHRLSTTAHVSSHGDRRNGSDPLQLTGPHTQVPRVLPSLGRIQPASASCLLSFKGLDI